MGTRERTLGGGAAEPLADDLVNVLRFFISGQQPGAPARTGADYPALAPWTWPADGAGGGPSPIDRTTGIARGIESMLTPFDYTELGKSLQSIMQSEIERGAQAVRSRFGAAGGTSLGTPAAYAESLFRAEAAPRVAATQGQLGLQARQMDAQSLTNLLQIMAALAGKGIPQAQTILQQSPWMSLLEGITGAAEGTAGLIKAIK